MNEGATQRFKDRERWVRERLSSLSTPELVTYAKTAISRMEPSQKKIARKLTLEELAKLELLFMEFFS